MRAFLRSPPRMRLLHRWRQFTALSSEKILGHPRRRRHINIFGRNEYFTWSILELLRDHDRQISTRGGRPPPLSFTARLFGTAKKKENSDLNNRVLSSQRALSSPSRRSLCFILVGLS